MTPPEPMFSIANAIALSTTLAVPVTGQAIDLEFLDATTSGRYPHEGVVRADFDPTERVDDEVLSRHLGRGFALARSLQGTGAATYLFHGTDSIVKARVEHSMVVASIAAGDPATIRALTSSLSARFHYRPSPEVSTPFSIWGDGFHRTTLHLSPVPFADIAQNYPHDTRTRLHWIMEQDANSPRNGRLMLWSGPPGTGKTWAIRALATAWQPWADIHVLLDAEEFFDRPAAIVDLVEAGSHRPILVVIEDADSLVSSRTTREGRLERLLNTADGIVGHSTTLYFLITTNATPSELDPAVGRPGRCFAEVRFDTFSFQEARRLIANPAVPVTDSMTLAQIFDAKHADPAGRALATARGGSTGQYL